MTNAGTDIPLISREAATYGPQSTLVQPFPPGGELLAAVQAEWDILFATGEPPPSDLPRPWDPATFTLPKLRQEIWAWLDAVADWINSECIWNPTYLIPACWAHHPHLIHELAVLADQRRQAGQAASSHPLQDWQRTTLPAFLERTREQIRLYCTQAHEDPPTEPSRIRYRSTPAAADRTTAFALDCRVPRAAK